MLLKVYKSRVIMLLLLLLPFIGSAQIPGLPAGWGFTLNPTGGSYAIQTSVVLEGVTLAPGDWIGAFYQDGAVLECGGAVQWTGTGNVALVAFGNDPLNPNKNGFADNELIRWKFYNSTTGEKCVKAYNSSNAEFYWVNGALPAVAKFTNTPIVTCPGNITGIKDTDPAFALTGGLPAGGVYTGPGVSGGIFTPSVAGVGTHTITYTYTEFTCSASCSFTIQVIPGTVTQTLICTQGWNWISFNVLPAGGELNDVLGDTGYTDGDFLQTPGGTADYYEGYGWYSETMPSIDPDKFYQLKIANAKTIVVTGNPVDVSDPINVFAGWNWIGYKPQGALELNAALNTLSPSEGDFIQTPGGTADYYEGYGWYSETMPDLIPGKGYQMKLASAGVLIYPSAMTDNLGVGKIKVESKDEITPGRALLNPPDWPAIPTFAFYQSGRYRVYINGNPIETTGSMLSVWKNGEIRGKINLTKPAVPAGSPWQFNLQMGSNLATEPGFTFLVYDAGTDKIYEIVETHTFVSGQNVGTALAPLPLTAIVPCVNAPTANAGVDFGVCAGADAYITTATATNYTALLWTSSGTGSFSSTSILSPIYTPSAADKTAGSVTLTLKASSSGCPDATDAMVLTINALPNVTCPANMTVNSNDPTFALTGATPTGGNYSGPGVSNNTFTPSVAGAGTHTITYEYTDAHGCFGSCQFTITVNLVVTIDICGTVTDAVTLAPIAGATVNAISGGSGGVVGPPTWPAIPTFAFYQSGRYRVYINGNPIETSGSMLSVWKNGEIRGKVNLTKPAVPAGSPWQFNLQMGSNLATEPGFTFLVYDAGTNKVYEIVETHTFVSGQNVGTALAPLPLTVLVLPGYEYNATTAADGTYCMVGVEPATYKITASKAGYIAGMVENVVVNGSVTQNFALVPECQNATANAGADAGICAGATYTLAGAATHYTTVLWTSTGDGVFSNATVLNPVYTPGAEDIAAGSVSLCLKAFATAPCNDATDCMTLTFQNGPTANAGADAAICADGSFYQLNGSASNYAAVQWATFNGIGYFSNEQILNPIYYPSPFDYSMGYVNLMLYAAPISPCQAGAEDEMILTFKPLPVANCPQIAPVCEGSAYIEFPVVEGGVYTQGGEVVFGFNPAAAGAYGFVLTVTQDGCVASCQFSITVNPLPVAVCPQIAPVCEGSAYITFPVVDGGVYTHGGEVVVGFNPAAAGTCNFELTVTNEFGCVDACQFSITVNPLPVANCPEIAPVCEGSAYITFPVVDGGVYTQNGQTVTGFNPAVAGVYGFVLTVTNEFGCVDACQFSIIVNPLPVVTCPPDFAVCINDQPWEIYGMSPAGGVFTGVGVVDGVNYDPALAGVGAHLITYTYTDGNGCTNSCTFTITVNPLPVFECPAYGPYCAGDNAVTFTGPGVYTNSDFVPVTGFDPIAEGNYTFHYTVTENGCSASCEFVIVVNPLPLASCPDYGDFEAGSPYITFPPVAGGVYTENGQVVTGFDPVTEGTYHFVLTVTQNGCVASCEFSVVVVPVPPVCPGWVNIQWPPSGTINVGNDYTVYAQIWIDGVTQLEGPTPGLSVAIGYSTVNTDPATWTNWVPATHNPFCDCGNNDEYMANIGAGILLCGEYYYASRFVYNNCQTVYGGLGNFWNGTSSPSGVLTVEGCNCQNPPTANAGADGAICANNTGYQLNGSVTNAANYFWSTLSGTGFFDNDFALNAVYFPSPVDYMMGSVELCLTAAGFEGCPDAIDCMTLTFNPLPVAVCPQIAPVCEGSAFIEFPAVEGGVYTQGGEVVVGFNPAVAGNYGFVLTVTNEFGCVDACQFSITVNPLPVAVCPQIAPVCEGSAYIEFPVYEMGVYTCSMGNVVTGFDPVMAGNYDFTLTVTNEFGCVDACQFSITVNPLPVAVCPQIAPVCEGSAYIEFPVVEGGVYTISMSTVSDIVTGFNPAEAGTYSFVLTVTNEFGCVDACQFSITVNPLPVAVCPQIAPVCEGSDFIEFPAVEGGVYTFDGEAVVGFNPAAAGNYGFVLTVTNEFGCVDACQFSIVVNPAPVAVCPQIAPVCEGSAYIEFPVVEGGVYTFNGEEVVGFNPAEAGNYGFVLTVTNEFGCVDACQFSITVNPLPVAVCPQIAPVCEGSAYIEFPVVEGGVYTFDGEAVVGFNPAAAGNYGFVLTVTNEFGCVDACQFSITVNPLPVAVCPQIAPVCEGSAYIEFPVVEGGVYTFNGEEVVGFNPAEAGNYGFVLTVTNEFGCVDACQFSITVNPLPVAICPQIAPVCEGSAYIEFPVVEGGVYTFDGEAVEGFNPAAAGNYGFVLTVTNEFGCSASCEFTIIVNARPELTEVTMVVTENGISWLPVEGDFEAGYSLCINPLSGGYALNIASLVATDELAVGFNGFYVSTYPANYFEYWNGRGVNAEAASGSWQAWMWQIINGNKPIFYINYTGVDYMLVDGLKKDYANQVTYLVLPGDYPEGAYTFTGMVENLNGCFSEDVTVSMNFKSFPLIVAQPENVPTLYGGVAVFTVGAQFTDSYQWYGPAGMLDGKTGNSLTLVGVTLEDAGDYYVAVTNGCATVNSAVATLTVNPWTQVINLPVKTNGVSTNLSLINDGVGYNVASLGANLQSMSFTRPSQVYVPGGVSFPWTEERGAVLTLKTTWPASISVTGWPTLGPLVTLLSGNSYLPVWSQGPVNVADVFPETTMGLNEFVQGITEAGKVYWPKKGINTLGLLVPGRAYLASLPLGGRTVNFNVPIVDGVLTDVSLPVNNTSWNDVENTGSSHAIALMKSAFAQLQSGDVIGVFNQNGIIAGMVQLDDLKNNAFLAVYADNTFTNETEGFVNGDLMTFKVYRNGEIIDAVATFDVEMPSTNIFNNDGVSAITEFKLSATSINEINANLNVNIFPNPAKNFVNIQTNFEITNLKVVNYVGQVIYDRPADQMNVQINTSNFAPGMYFVQIEGADGNVITKRLTIN